MSQLTTSAAFGTSSFAPSKTPLVNDISNSSAASPTITVSIPLSSLLSDEEIARLDTFKGKCDEKFWITRLISRNKQKKSDANSASGQEGKDRVKDVQMSRAEYEAFWARDQDGRYIGTEPEGKGREILRKRLWAELGLFEKVGEIRTYDDLGLGYAV